MNQPNQMSFINSAPIVDVECFGASTGQISVEVIGGLGPFDFSYLPNVGSLVLLQHLVSQFRIYLLVNTRLA